MRPEVDAVQDATDITGWYWTKSELLQIARRLGVRRSGSKQDLIEAITANLAGRMPRPVGTVVAGKPLRPPFSVAMAIPAGQPFTRELRNWVQSQFDGDVRVTAVVRDLLRNPVTPAGSPATLGDLIDLIEKPLPASEDIGPQFERNRFMRLLSKTEPGMPRDEREQKWRAFRDLPTARRSMILAAIP